MYKRHTTFVCEPWMSAREQVKMDSTRKTAKILGYWKEK